LITKTINLDVAEKSDTSYGEVATKLNVVETELDKAEERGEMAETKSSELEEELKNLANNLRTLEAASEKYQQKEAAYIADIQSLEDKLADVSYMICYCSRQFYN